MISPTVDEIVLSAYSQRLDRATPSNLPSRAVPEETGRAFHERGLLPEGEDFLGRGGEGWLGGHQHE